MSHSHEPAGAGFGTTFALGVALNLGIVAGEAWFGWRTGSLALLADAAHNLSDVGGLLLAWGAFSAARLRPDARHTYGWRRGSILAALANTVILLFAMGTLAWEAIERLQTPAPVDALTVMYVAAACAVVNALTAWLFLAGSKQDLNIRGAFLHMAGDALVSIGVVVAGALFLWKGWTWIDPVTSLLIALVIMAGTWSLFRHSLHLLFDGVPADVELVLVHRGLLEVPGVTSVHDLHVWAMSTMDYALTAHLVVETGGTDRDEILRRAVELLRTQFGIRHVSLQCESPDFAGRCTSDPEGLVCEASR